MSTRDIILGFDRSLFEYHYLDQAWSILPALGCSPLTVRAASKRPAAQGGATPMQAKWIKLDLITTRTRDTSHQSEASSSYLVKFCSGYGSKLCSKEYNILFSLCAVYMETYRDSVIVLLHNEILQAAPTKTKPPPDWSKWWTFKIFWKIANKLLGFWNSKFALVDLEILKSDIYHINSFMQMICHRRGNVPNHDYRSGSPLHIRSSEMCKDVKTSLFSLLSLILHIKRFQTSFAWLFIISTKDTPWFFKGVNVRNFSQNLNLQKFVIWSLCPVKEKKPTKNFERLSLLFIFNVNC